MDIKDIQNLIKFVAKAGVSEVKYKTKDFEIFIKPHGSSETTTVVPQQPIYQQPTPQINVSTVVPQQPVAPTEADEDKFVTIKSPMIGTFYRKTAPDKEILVNVGDKVAEGDVVCVIEAMKLFNHIESEVSGKIVKVLVDDATPVEYDQPLFLVDPS